MLELYEQRFGAFDAIQPGDLETIAQPLDYLGVNFYRPNVVMADDDGSVLGIRDVPLDGETDRDGLADRPVGADRAARPHCERLRRASRS